MRKILILSALSVYLACIIPFTTNAESFSNAFTGVCLCREPVEMRPDTIPKISLLKKISHFLKFHKNIREAERKRILDVINKTFLRDSILANANDIRILNAALKDTINQKFDSLVALINSIRLSDKKYDSLPPPDTAGFGNNTVISDSMVNELMERMLPLLINATRINTGTLPKLTVLKDIRLFYGRPRRPLDTVYFMGALRTEDACCGEKNAARTTILKRKTAIYSFFPSGMGGNYLDYNFGIIGTLVYDGYRLNGKTGLCNDMGDPGTDNSLEKAKDAGCELLLSVKSRRQDDAEIFLENEHHQQEAFTAYILDRIDALNADGINIDFGPLMFNYRKRFITFIKMLSGVLRDKGCRLLITVPCGSMYPAYDINDLNAPNIKFLLDFRDDYPGRSPGAPAALKGDNSIGSAVTRYLNSNVPPAKFIIGMPYYGAQWRINAQGKEQFEKYLSFDEIASRFSAPVLQDPRSSSAFIKLRDDEHKLTGQVWFNDTVSLNNIYTFILRNRLGGIAVIPLNKGIGFNRLWREIGDKFLSIHTFPADYFKYIKCKERKYMDSVERESFDSSWKYFKKYDSSFRREIGFLFEHPCETEFHVEFNSPVLNQSLYKDSTILLMNDPAILNQSLYSVLLKYDSIPMDIRMASRVRFFRVRRVIDFFAFAMSLFFLAGFIGVFCVYINRLRRSGKQWRFRKLTGIILLLSASLFIFFIFIYLFLSDIVPGFGSNNGTVCYDMPIQTLLLVIASGIVLGIVIMRFLIFPLIKRDDIP